MVFLASRMLLGSLGPRLNAERVEKSAGKLERIPEAIAGWEWDKTVKDTSADIARVTGGGWNLFVRSYVKPDAGRRLYVQVCRWLDPLSCYEMHGWRVVPATKPFLIGSEGQSLRSIGVKEGWIEKSGERMAVLFWESDLLDPAAVREGALTEDVGAKGRLSRLWGRTQRRLKSFFQKSDIIVKVIYSAGADNEGEREEVLQFARAIQGIIVELLK